MEEAGQRTSRHRWLARYTAAVAAVGAGFLLRLGLTALVGEGLPTYITFYPAVMAVALLGGFGPGLVATVATVLAVDYWILPPHGSLAIGSLQDAVGLALFSGMGVFMSVVAELYRRAQQKAAGHDTELLRWERLEKPWQPIGETVLLVGGLALSLTILGAVGWQTYRNLAATAHADRWVSHTYIVDDELERLFSTIEDMEASERGYLITGQEDYLRPYDMTKRAVAGQLASLKRLTQGSPSQTQRLTGIAALADAKLAELKEVIEVRRSQGLEAAQALMATGKDRTLMEEIRKRVTEAEDEEQRLLDARTTARDTELRTALQTLLAGGVLSFVLLTTIFLFLKQENNRRRLAEGELRRHQADLRRTVLARTADLSQANESLRQQREWLRVTLSSIGDAVLATDTAGQITFLNPVAEALTGWELKEALGQPFESVFRTINEETRVPGEDIVARVLRERRAIALANHTALVTRDGREVAIEDSAAPIKDGTGTVSGVVLVFHDVTEKRRAQAAIRESQRQNELLANVIEHSSQAFGMGFPDGRLGLVNRAFEELTGYSAAELRAVNWAETLTPPEWREVERQKLEELRATSQPVRYEKEYLRKDGRRVPIELLVHLARDAEGRPAYYYSFLTDITERKRAEEAERRLNAELQQHVTELKVANEALSASRTAAVRLMEDAVQARRQAEQAAAELRESQERLAAFAAASFEGIILSDQGLILDCNDQFAQMLGTTRQAVIGCNVEQFIAPEDRQRVMENVRSGRESVLENEMVRLDGSRITVEGHGRPHNPAGGGLRHTAIRDITERKQREEQLHQLNRALRAHAKSDHALLRAQGESDYLEAVSRIVVEDCGHAMVWIGFAEEDEGKTVRPVAQAGFEEGYLGTLNVTWADTERGRGPTGTAIRTGRPILCHNMLTDPRFEPWRAEALKRGYASSLGLPLLADGRAFGVLTIYSKQPEAFSDIEVGLLTELAGDIAYGITTLRLRAAKARAEESLRQATADLQRSNRDLEQFAYAASHDLQEPLRAVGGYVKLLQHRFRDKLDAKAQGYITGAFDGAMRMERLITDLLAYSRVGTGGGNFAPAELSAVLRHALDNLEARVKSAQATITHDPLPSLSVDATQIMRLFQNLISNALKFHSEPPPQIHIGARPEEGRWVLWVRDNGIGIEAEYFERIFQVFQRLHTRNKYPGTGIGLAICKKIVERHGGSIWVESQPGQGATFFFTLPETSGNRQAVA